MRVTGRARLVVVKMRMTSPAQCIASSFYFLLIRWLLIKIIKSNGPSYDPCGTSDESLIEIKPLTASIYDPFTMIYCLV